MRLNYSINYTRIITVLAIVLICGLLFWSIRRQIKEYYLQDDPVLQKLNRNFTEFFERRSGTWKQPLEMLNRRNNVMREIQLFRGDKSYTINKEKVYICLKDEQGDYYNENMLTYVLAHEISHVICDEIGHTEKFHRIFDALLKEMIEDELYNPSIPIQQNYCENGDPEM